MLARCIHFLEVSLEGGRLLDSEQDAGQVVIHVLVVQYEQAEGQAAE